MILFYGFILVEREMFMAEIRFENIVKKYDTHVTAVHNFTLQIKDKEFVILVGPSGCGKSTLLRMIAGLEEITDGKLFIGDKCVNRIESKDRDIAMVFQNYALYPHMTVYQNMAFALKLKKIPKNEIKKRVETIAQQLQITPLLKRKPGQLSGGQRQRVALGRAMVRKPAVFLLDEPLSNLDAKLRTQMRSEIRLLHQRLQTTFVYVTHDQTEAMTMGDRIVVMKDGLIQQADTPQMIYNCPGNLFVAQFIGSPQMNCIKGEIQKKSTEIQFVFEGGSVILPQKYEKAFANNLPKEIILGIRPENIHLYDTKEEKPWIEGVVELTELLGAELYCHVLCQTTSLTARLPLETGLKRGDSLKLVFDTDKIHLFDSETEKAFLVEETQERNKTADF